VESLCELFGVESQERRTQLLRAGGGGGGNEDRMLVEGVLSLAASRISVAKLTARGWAGLKMMLSRIGLGDVRPWPSPASLLLTGMPVLRRKLFL